MVSRKAAAEAKPAPRRRAATKRRGPAGPGPLFPIVALGASAGGLEAFEQFFHHAPADMGMAFVLVQHLDPSHASMLVEILQRATPMSVVEAADAMEVLPNRVHVIPPNRDMAIVHGRLQLTEPAEAHGMRMPIDTFLRSLASDQGERAVGIVLSGTGTDGTQGLRAVLDAGGRCLVQDPASAKFDSMPGSAIKAGCATQVLPVEKMPQALIEGSTKMPSGRKERNAAAGLAKILAQLRAATVHDFALYKQSTISRRIERRMAQHGIADIEAYARFTREHPGELQLLFRELLINVTSFFRDPEAFALLKRKVIPSLVEGRTESQPLRIWVAGCATGEEVYSVAMVAREWMDESQREFRVQLYGTDLDDDAIKVARAGLYPHKVAQVLSPERLRRFFVREEGGYRVKKELREMAVFAVQSVIKDPPFTRLDLLCCRNLLIYLEPELQNRLIPMFHYALRAGGVLFLSPSESLGGHADLFEIVDRKWKLYRAKPTPLSARKMLSEKVSWVSDGSALPSGDRVDHGGEQHIADLARRALLQSFAPAAVLTDLQGNVLYVHGDTGAYLRPAPGHPTHNVVDMAREGLQLELREALRVAATDGTPASRRVTLQVSAGESRGVTLTVRPLPDRDEALAVLLVSFQPALDVTPERTAQKPRGKLSVAAQRVAELNSELLQARERLRAMLEEQQISNEELKSTNEELQSTNEELQSSNEELETSKEELQSVNEELVTVNAELQAKIEQMSVMQDDMKNLLDNLRLGTIFLDRNLLIRRFTRDATQVFRLAPSDVGRSLADIRSELLDCDLLADAEVVLDSLVPTEREARTADGKWILARIQPYRTVDNVIDGVVLTFADVTDRVNALAAQEARSLAEAVVDAVAVPLVVLDGQHRIISANRAFHALFHTQPGTTIGQDLFELDDHRWNLPAVRQLLEAPWPDRRVTQARECDVDLPGAVAPRFRLDARRIVAQPADRVVVLLSIASLEAVPAAG